MGPGALLLKGFRGGGSWMNQGRKAFVALCEWMSLGCCEERVLISCLG